MSLCQKIWDVNTPRGLVGFRLEEEEKETRLINWQIVARYSNRPRRNDSLELRLLSSFRTLCNCVGQDETPSRLYPARLIETGYDTRFPGTTRRFPRGARPPPWWRWNDRWNVANYWILKDRVRWSWQETRRIYEENRVLKSTWSADCRLHGSFHLLNALSSGWELLVFQELFIVEMLGWLRGVYVSGDTNWIDVGSRLNKVYDSQIYW